MIGPFRDSKQYYREYKKLWHKITQKYPVFLLPWPPNRYQEKIWKKALREFEVGEEEIKKRLSQDLEKQPIDLEESDQIKIMGIILSKEQINALNHPWIVIHQKGKSGKICKGCGKFSLYNPDDPPYVRRIDIMWGEGMITFRKFKYRDYCSDECKKKARNERRRKIKPIKTCLYCHSQYEGRARTCHKYACQKQAFRDSKKAKEGILTRPGPASSEPRAPRDPGCSS